MNTRSLSMWLGFAIALTACATSATDPDVEVNGDEDGSGSGSGSGSAEPVAACAIRIDLDNGTWLDLAYDDKAHLTQAGYGGNTPTLYGWSVIPVKADIDTATLDADVAEFPSVYSHPTYGTVLVQSRLTYLPSNRIMPSLRVYENGTGDVLETLEYAYTGDRLTSDERTDKDGATTHKRRYYYTATGQLSALYEDAYIPGNTTPTFKYYSKYTRDSAGRLATVETLVNGSPVHVTTFAYDASGLPIQSVTTGTGAETQTLTYSGDHCAAAVGRWRKGWFDSTEP